MTDPAKPIRGGASTGVVASDAPANPSHAMPDRPVSAGEATGGYQTANLSGMAEIEGPGFILRRPATELPEEWYRQQALSWLPSWFLERETMALRVKTLILMDPPAGDLESKKFMIQVISLTLLLRAVFTSAEYFDRIPLHESYARKGLFPELKSDYWQANIELLLKDTRAFLSRMGSGAIREFIRDKTVLMDFLCSRLPLVAPHFSLGSPNDAPVGVASPSHEAEYGDDDERVHKEQDAITRLWGSHLSENRRRISAVAELLLTEQRKEGNERGRRPTVMILGGGLALDIDLAKLAEDFEVILVDINPEFLNKALEKVPGNLKAHVHVQIRDLTETVVETLMLEALSLISRSSDIEQAVLHLTECIIRHINRLKTPDLTQGKKVDLLVSSMLLTQFCQPLQAAIPVAFQKLWPQQYPAYESLITSLLMGIRDQLAINHIAGLRRAMESTTGAIYFATEVLRNNRNPNSGQWSGPKPILSQWGEEISSLQDLLNPSSDPFDAVGFTRWLWQLRDDTHFTVEAKVLLPKWTDAAFRRRVEAAVQGGEESVDDYTGREYRASNGMDAPEVESSKTGSIEDKREHEALGTDMTRKAWSAVDVSGRASLQILSGTGGTFVPSKMRASPYSFQPTVGSERNLAIALQPSARGVPIHYLQKNALQRKRFSKRRCRSVRTGKRFRASAISRFQRAQSRRGSLIRACRVR